MYKHVIFDEVAINYLKNQLISNLTENVELKCLNGEEKWKVKVNSTLNRYFNHSTDSYQQSYINMEQIRKTLNDLG